MSDQSAPLATEAPADAPTPVSSVAPPRAHWWSKALDFYWTNYLPLMMIFSVLFGYIVPAPGASRVPLSPRWLSQIARCRRYSLAGE